jgi:hypothetical protein
MTLYKELGQAFKLKRQEDETFTDFAIRASTRVNKCTDAQWKELSAELQTWNNEVMEMREANAALTADAEPGEFPELEGFPEEEASEAEETAVDEDGVVQEASEEEAEEATEEGTEGEATEEEQDAEAEIEKATKLKQEPEGRRKMRTAVAEKEKPVAKARVVAKAKVAAPAKAAKSNGDSSRTRLDPEAKIKILAKENPHREGSGRYKRWSKYRDGMTVAAALKVGFNSGDIQHSVADGNIKLV